TRSPPGNSVSFSKTCGPAPPDSFCRRCMLKAKELLTRQEAADGNRAGPTREVSTLTNMVQRSRRSPLAAGFQYRLLPSPQPGDRDRDSSCSSSNCNVAKQGGSRVTHLAFGPPNGLCGSPPASAPAGKVSPKGSYIRVRIATEPTRSTTPGDNLARHVSAKTSPTAPIPLPT